VKDKGGGKTPPMVVELLTKAVSEKSQSAVARETGLTLLTVQRYLKGVGEPRDKNLKRLSDYFGVSVSELRGEGYFVPVAFDDTYSSPLYLPERGYWRLLKLFHNVFSEDSTIDKNIFAVRSIYKLALSSLDKIDMFWDNLTAANSLSENGVISNTPIKEIEDYAVGILEPFILLAQNDVNSEAGNEFYRYVVADILKESNNNDHGKLLLKIYAAKAIDKYFEMLETIDFNEMEFLFSIYKDSLTTDEIDIYNSRLAQNKNSKQKNRRNKKKE